MSLSTKLKELKDVHFTELTKKQADGVVVVLGKTSEEAAIKELCEGLDTVQLDTLMRVIYKGLESGKSSSVLFRWHAVVSDVGGKGCIIRTLMDKVPPEASDEDED